MSLVDDGENKDDSFKNQSETTLIKCTECGCESTLPELFFRRYTFPICPRCAYKLQKIRQKNAIQIYRTLGLGVVLLISILLIFGNSVGRMLAFTLSNSLLLIILVLAFCSFSILHLLICAVTTWLLGGRVFNLKFGSSNVFFQKNFRGVDLSIGRSPFGGQCIMAFPTIWANQFRTNCIAYSLPFSYAVLGLALLVNAHFSNLWLTLAWREVLVIFTLGMTGLMAYSIWKNRGMTTVTDTNSQLRYPIKVRWTAEELHASYFLLEAQQAYRAKRYSECIEICQTGLAMYPNHMQLRSFWALSLLEQQKFVEASEEYEKILQSPSRHNEPSMFLALHYNNAAWIELLNEQNPDRLETSSHHIQQAFRMTPWVPNILGTLGSLLIEKGELEQGIEYVLEAAEVMQEHGYLHFHKNIAINFGYAAIGCNRLGEYTEAQEFLQEAEKYAADEYIVQKAKKELAK